MKLTPKANLILRNDPELFLQMYGNRYVNEVHYGGSFFGYQNANPVSGVPGNDTALKELAYELNVNHTFFT